MWSTIPSEILEMILVLVSLADMASASAVCVQWCRSVRTFVTNHGLTIRHRSWLVLSNRPYEQAIPLMNPLQRSTSPWARRFCGAHGDWLGVLDRNDGVYLFHPMLHHHIPLPPLDTLPFHAPHSFFEHRTPSFVRKVILSSPPTSAECIVAIIFGNEDLAFCRLGDAAWTELEPLTRRKRRYDDAVFSDGQLVAVDTDGCARSFEVASGKNGSRALFRRSTRHLADSYNRHFLVESNGQLLMVVRKRKKVWVRGGMLKHYSQYATFGFQVIQLVSDGKRGMKLGSLGKRVMFLAPGISTLIDSEEIEEDFGSDCIYYAECENMYPLEPADTGVYFLADKTRVQFGEEDGVVCPRWGHRVPLFFAMFNNGE